MPTPCLSESQSSWPLPCPDLGAWRSGNTGTEGVWQFDSGQPGRQVLITALVHGNEICGAWALKGLLESGLRPQRGVLTLALCNLAAFDRFDAQQPAGSRFVDEDFNRVWQADKLAQPRTQERQRALQIQPFAQAADWLLDIHSMSSPSAPLQLAGLHPRNLALAAAMGAPAHVVIDAGHQEGVRLRDFGAFGQPDELAPGRCALLVECGVHGELAARSVAQDQCARFLVAAGTVDEALVQQRLPGWRQPDVPTQWALQVTDAVVSRGEGFAFNRAYQGLELIERAGTVLADNQGEPVITPYDDCVLVMPAARAVPAGVTAVRFARRKPLLATG